MSVRGVGHVNLRGSAEGRTDELHQTQLFLTDPSGIGVELTFTNPPIAT